MAKRDEFDDEGFFDSLLNRKGKTAMPPGLRRIFIVISILVLIGILIAVVASSVPTGSDGDDSAVPIIRAETTPYKIKPEDPGGMNVPNKDSTIFETLKGQPEENKVENLLEDESDTAASVVRDEAPAKAAPVTDINDLKIDDAEDVSETETSPPQPVAPKVEAPKVEAAKIEPAKKVEPKVEPKEEVSIIDTLKADSKPATAPVKKVESKPVVKAEPVKSSGSTYIQLAAVKSEAEASTQWSKFKAKNPELSALSMRAQKADLGEKGIFYRIQAGPLSAADATKTCAAVKSRGGNCIIAK